MKQTAAPKKPKAASKPREISHVVTTKAENGVLNEVHHVPDAGYGYSEPQKHVHATPESAGSQVSELMGGKPLTAGKEPDEAC